MSKAVFFCYILNLHFSDKRFFLNLVLEMRLIKPVDENTSPRNMKYIPIWA